MQNPSEYFERSNRDKSGGIRKASWRRRHLLDLEVRRHFLPFFLPKLSGPQPLLVGSSFSED